MQIDGLIAKCYPTEEHYGRWNERAENAGMFVSGFIASIVEEDHMMFSMNVEPDESNRELPQKRDFMGHQLKEVHDDNRSLEKSTFRSAARTIEEYIREYPGWTRGEIIDAVTA